MKVNVIRYLARHFVFWFGMATAVLSSRAQTVQTNLAVTTLQAPSLNGGTIQGSLQELTGASFNVNSGFVMTGDLLVPGTPTLTLNGNPAYSGTIVGSGSASPSGYQITLNSGCSLRYLRTRTTPTTLPAVAAPSAPTGTRSVNINSAGQSLGTASTLDNLTLNGNVGMYSVPPGTYGTFSVNGGSGLILGVTGAVQAVSYNLQNLNLNSGSIVQIVGPVVLTVANGCSANGVLGATNNPAWLQVQVASGGLTLNSGCAMYGSVLAPNGAVCIDGNSTLVGVSASQQFTLNSGGLVRWSGASTQTNQPPTATPQSVTLVENSSTNITLTGSDPQGKTLTYALLTLPAHGTVTGTPPSVTYKPATNYYGSDSFTFNVNNGTTNSAPATVSLVVSQVYFPPVAYAQNLTNVENTGLPITLTGSDPEGYALAYSVVTQPAHGTLTGTTPNLTYLPATNYYGNDAFTFRVNDGVSNSAPATISITNRAVDYPPVVAAGASQSIIWPSNLVNLAGTVSYANFPGTVDTVLWSKVSGPGSVTFSNASSAVTTATFSTNGVYQLQFFASDSYLSSSNILRVTVDQAPVVNAGLNQTNLFPGAITLRGSVTDDGLPTGGALTTTWSLVSGPGTVVFSTAVTSNVLAGVVISNAIATTATFSTNGVYVLQLTASDGLATNHATVTVTEDRVPVANSQTVTLPENSSTNITLTGSDPQGLTLSYTVLTQPTHGSLSGTPPSLAYNPAANFYGSDSFAFQVNNGLTNSASATISLVVSPVDYPPVVVAGTNQSIVWPSNLVNLAGTVSNANYPGTMDAVLWSKVSGPGNVTFANANATNTTATFSAPGLYVLKLQASDGVTSNSGTMTVTVDQGPAVSLATPAIVTWPSNQVTLSGLVTDNGLPSGGMLTTSWSLVSGPGTASFSLVTTSNALTGIAISNVISSTATFSASGLYVMRLTVGDGLTTASTNVTVTVNRAPAAYAGTNQSIIWPFNQVLLQGVAVDDGLPIGNNLITTWSKVSGAGTVTFANANVTNTTATFSASGIYGLMLTASDGVSSNSSVLMITVDQAPLVSLATPAVVNWPSNQVALSGLVTDDGLPSRGTLVTSLSLVSGPGTASFSSVTTSNLLTAIAISNVISSMVTFSAPGLYVVCLTANDGLFASTTNVTVTVNAPPVVDAGTNQLVVLPVNQVTLQGTASDDGLPVGSTLTSTWMQVSGPGTVTFANANATSTTATFSTDGVYVLQLSAADGAVTSSSTVVITVVAGPAVSINPPALINWPTNQVTLSGTVTDDGLPAGGALVTTWNQVSGPGTVSFSTVTTSNALTGSAITNAVNATATFSSSGLYTLQLTASDGVVSNSANVTVTVNQPPVVSAGTDQILVWPANQAVLDGFVSDDGLPAGSSLTMNWSVVSGPGTVTFANANVTNTIVSFSQTGIYTLQLTASDTAASASGQVSVTVLATQQQAQGLTSIGTNFWVSRLNGFYDIRMRWIMMLAPQDTDVTITAPSIFSYDSDGTFSTAPGGISLVSLQAGVPYMGALEELLPWAGNPDMASDVITNVAFQVSSIAPISIFVIDFSGNDSPGFLALPTDMLGTNYIIAAYANFDHSTMYRGNVFGSSQFSVTAAEDDTTVTVVPSVTTGGHPAGQPYSETLQQGQTYNLCHTETAGGDLTGSTVMSDKPVAVLGGNAWATIPTNQGAASGISAQLLPVENWDSEYVVAQLAGRSSYAVRVLAGYDGTEVQLSGYGETNLNRGQFWELFLTNDIQVVASQPVAVYQYATGNPADPIPGAPAMILVPGVHQGLTDFQWMTPEAVGTVNFGPVMAANPLFTNFVNFVVPSGGLNTLTINGAPLPTNALWNAVGDGQFSKVSLPITNGVYQIHCSEPVVTVNYGVYNNPRNGAGSYGLPGPFSLAVFPQIAVVSPAYGSLVAVGEPTSVIAQLTDPQQVVTNVQFLLNGVPFTQDATTNFTWTPTQPGSFALQLVAATQTGGSITSAPVQVTVDSTFKTEGVQIIEPEDGDFAYVGVPTTIGLGFDDPLGEFAYAEFFTNGVSLGQTTNTAFTWTPSQLGNCVLSAVIYSDSGQTYPVSNPVTVQVVAPPEPVVSIPQSFGSNTFYVDNPLQIQLDISDPGRMLDHVSLFANGNSLGQAVNGVLAWTPIQINSYVLSAQVFDLMGNSFPATNTVTIQVVQPPPPVVAISWPVAGQSLNFSKPVVITAAVTGPAGSITHYDFVVDGVTHLNSSQPSAVWSPIPGMHTFQVIAFDRFGQSGASLLVPATVAVNAGLANYDSRLQFLTSSNYVSSVLGTSAATIEAAAATFKQQWPQIQLDYDPILLTPTAIIPTSGYLTGPGGAGITVSNATAQLYSPTDPALAVEAFLHDQSSLFGYDDTILLDEVALQKENVDAASGLLTLVWQQYVGGAPVFNALLIGHITQADELVTMSSGFIPDSFAAKDIAMYWLLEEWGSFPTPVTNAVANAFSDVGDVALANGLNIQDAPADVTQSQSFTAPGLNGLVYASLTWFPVSRTQLRLCWQVIFTSPSRGEMFQTLVAADTGEVLYRRSLTACESEATYRVFTGRSPAPLSPGWPSPDSTQAAPVQQSLVQLSSLDPFASPLGWISDGVNETLGNNVDAHLNLYDNDASGVSRPTGNPAQVFDFDFTGDPTTSRNASVVQLFFWDNWMHDTLYNLGFNETSGNFQTTNFNRGGLGGDAVQANAQDGALLYDLAYRDNANMSTPPDGYPPRMNMYLFGGLGTNRDGDFDAEVVLHEYTHGLSTRLIGGGAGIDALQTAGMGEGWSDFYALSLLADPTEDVDADYPIGAYSAYHMEGTDFDQNYYYGLRTYPYTTDMSKNPLTFKDIDPTQASSYPGVPSNPLLGEFQAAGASEVHHQGEVWCSMLWEVRASLIREYGFAVGSPATLQLITMGLRLSPPNPTFVQARDAIVLADEVLNQGSNAPLIWAAFAKRGLGYTAQAPDSSTTTGVIESYESMPSLQVVGVVVSGGSNSETLEITVANQGSEIESDIVGVLQSETAGVSVTGATNYFDDLPPGGGRDGGPYYSIQIDPSLPQGQKISLALVMYSDQGTFTNYLSLYNGQPDASVLFDDYSQTPVGPVSAASTVNISRVQALALTSTQVLLTWDSDAGTNQAIYMVERKAGASGQYQTIGSVIGATSYQDQSVLPGGDYFYQLSAFDYAGQSPYSAAVEVTTPASLAPLPLGDLGLWWMADAVGVSNGASVGLWPDLSGLGNNGTQSDGSQQPVLVTNVLNGRAVVRFDGVGDYLNIPNFMSSFSNAEMFVVLKAANGTPSVPQAAWSLGGCQGFAHTAYPNTNGVVLEDFASTNLNVVTPVVPLDQFNLFDVAGGDGGWASWINGTLAGWNETNTFGYSSSPMFGASFVPLDNSWSYFAGDVAEVLIFDRVLTATESAAVQQYLNNRYLLVAGIPATPANLNADAFSATQIALTWAPAQGSGSYILERQVAGGSYLFLATVTNGTAFVDSGLTPATQYTYRVSAVNLAGTSGASAAASATTWSSGTDLPVGSIALWLKADSDGLTNGAPVAQWRDLSGSGNDATQTNSAQQPLVVSGQLNGKSVIHFDGVNDFLALPDFMNGMTQSEVFVVWRAAPAVLGTDNGGLGLGTGGGRYPAADGSLVEDFGMAAPVNLGVPPQSPAQFVLYNVQAGGGIWVARMDGRTLVSTPGNGFSASPAPRLGMSPLPFGGNIAEVLVFARALSDGERDTVAQYFNNRYALVTNTLSAPQVTISTNSASSVTLVWNAGPPDTAGYLIERAVGTNGAFVVIASLPGGDDTSFTDSTPDNGLSYTYLVQAVDMTGAPGAPAEILRPSSEGGLWPMPADPQVQGNNSVINLQLYSPLH